MPPPERGENTAPSGVRALKAPRAPTEQEYEDHMASHFPRQPWCRHCIAGAGKSDFHKRQESDKDRVDTVSVDYCFMGEKESTEVRDPKCLPILVVRDHTYKVTFAHAVPSKGTVHDYCHKQLCRDLIALGHTEFILKSDQEPSILDLKRAAVKELRNSTGAVGNLVVDDVPSYAPRMVTFEESPVASSGSNGHVERAVWEIEAQIRVLRHMAEELHGVVLPVSSPLLPWAVEFAGALVTRSQRSNVDGKTAYERHKGKKYQKRLPWWSEKIMFMLAGTKRAKSEDRFLPGIFLGLSDRSDELVVGTPTGCFKARTIRRLPMAERKDPEFVKACIGVPRCT